MEAILPIKIEVPSLRVMAECQIAEADWQQSKIASDFNKKVKSRNLKEGDLVQKHNRAPIHDPRGKFRPNWIGPYIIKTIWSGGAIILMDLDGLEFSQPINIDKLKEYYP
ncbi:hypothetical protein ACSBR1_029774 [Camellia fascicularis]